MLRNIGYRVTFISFSKDYDQCWIDKLINNKENYACWDPDLMCVDDFFKLLSGYDIIITARYHGAVFASLLSRPFICIEIEQKLSLVADIYKGGGFLWRQPFNPQECVQLTKQIVENYQNCVDVINRVTKMQQEHADKMKQEFYEYLDLLAIKNYVSVSEYSDN